MSFQRYRPKQIQIRPIDKGTASIDKGGTARFCREDLESVGIKDTCSLLFDPATMRIAFKKPSAAEEGETTRVSTPHSGKKADGRRAQIRIVGVLHEMRLEPADVMGRYPLTRKDDLLVISLDQGETKEKE